MKQIIIILFIAFLCISCGTNKKTQGTLEMLPSVNTSTKVTIKEIFKTDTVFVEIPAQEATRTTIDSLSFLETDYACSTAQINQDGTLYHDLKNKAQKKPVLHNTPTFIKDSVAYIDRRIPVPVPTPIALTAWERFSIDYFKWILPLFILALIWILKKPLLSIVRRYI